VAIGSRVLMLLRHAIAEDGAAGQPDGERRLTREGKRKLREVVAGMRVLELRARRPRSSPRGTISRRTSSSTRRRSHPAPTRTPSSRRWPSTRAVRRSCSSGTNPPSASWRRRCSWEAPDWCRCRSRRRGSPRSRSARCRRAPPGRSSSFSRLGSSAALAAPADRYASANGPLGGLWQGAGATRDTGVANAVGRVQAIWRYPIKSFRGERLAAASVAANGLTGDRAYALRERATGRVMSAKRWARLFECGAVYPDGPLAPPEVTMPDGRRLPLAPAGHALSAWLGRDVEIARASPEHVAAYEIAIQTVEDIEAGVDQLAVEAGDFPCPSGSFFDAAPLHVLTDATLAALHASYPEGRFDVRRFRPNVVIETGGAVGYPEEGWSGRTLALGDDVQAAVLMGTIRCVMTTLPQDDLPRDPKILRAVAQHAGGNAGVYATVAREGTVRVGDTVTVT
jgi:uncharacterized protein YcbX